MPVLTAKVKGNPADEAFAGYAKILPTVNARAARLASAQGLYRVFNAAGYRMYWSNSGPPVAGGAPQAFNATLPFTPSSAFSDGTWYLSMSYFDGVLDSGFLPIGPAGQTYLTMILSGGVLQPTLPTAPTNTSLVVQAGGVIQVVGYYATAAGDGVNAATEWDIAYTTDGSTPSSNSPSIRVAFSAGGSPIQTLMYSLPTQTGGTVVKVQLQVGRALSPSGYAYSTPGTVLAATAVTAGPSSPLGIQSWAGVVPPGVQ
jgi:hypothetical protein